MDKGTFAGRVKRQVSGWLDAAASNIVDFANSPALVEASARHAQTTAAGPARFRTILPWASGGALLLAIAAFCSPSPALVTGAWVGGLTVVACALGAFRRKLAGAQGAATAGPLLALLGAGLTGAAWPFALARLGEPSGSSGAYLLGAAGAVLLAAALGRSAWGRTPDDIRRQLGRTGQRSAWLLLALYGVSAIGTRLLPPAGASWLEAALLCGTVLAGLWLAAEVAWTAGKRILGHAAGPSALRDDLGVWLRGAHARVTAHAGQSGTGGSAAATAAAGAALTTLTMVALALGIALLNKGTDLVRLGGLAAPFAEELHVSVDTILLWSISGLLAGTLGSLYWVVVRRGRRRGSRSASGCCSRPPRASAR